MQRGLARADSVGGWGEGDMGASPEVCGRRVISQLRVRARGPRWLRGEGAELASWFGGGGAYPRAEERSRFGDAGGNLSSSGKPDSGRRHVGGGAEEAVLQGESGEARPRDLGSGLVLGDRGRAELASPGLAVKGRPGCRALKGDTGCARLGGSPKPLEGRREGSTVRGLPPGFYDLS